MEKWALQVGGEQQDIKAQPSENPSMTKMKKLNI